MKVGLSMERYRGYRIEQTENGFRITLDDGSGKHTHIKSKSFCKRLIDFVVDNKVPPRVSNYILESCIRLSSKENYIQKISKLIETRKLKDKQYYFNPHKKRF